MPATTSAELVYPFPAEITLLFLENAPSHSTLHAPVLTCRGFHDCYSPHRESILRAVLTTELGPALHYTRALFSVFNCDTARTPNELDEALSYPTQYFARQAGVIGREERERLTHFLTTANRLEDHFSIIEKNRCSPTSQLTPHESFLFRRALFRIWTITQLYAQEPRSSELVTDVADIFDALTVEETVQMKEVHWFLNTIEGWKLGEPDVQALSSSPESILRRFEAEDRRPDPAASVQYDPWLDFDTCYSINLEGVSEGDDWRTSIVLPNETAHSVTICGHCDKRDCASKLWGRNNWHLLQCYTPRDYFFYHDSPGHLPGKLSHNVYAAKEIEPILNSPHALSTIINAMFDIAEEDLTADHYLIYEPLILDCSRDKWMCDSCLLGFMGQRLLPWLLTTPFGKLQNQKPRCREGHNCIDQTTDIIHATQYNHICRPEAPLRMSTFWCPKVPVRQVARQPLESAIIP